MALPASTLVPRAAPTCSGVSNEHGSLGAAVVLAARHNVTAEKAIVASEALVSMGVSVITDSMWAGCASLEQAATRDQADFSQSAHPKDWRWSSLRVLLRNACGAYRH